MLSSRRTIVSEVPTDRRGLILPPINIDPPDHTDRRRILLPFFSPQATARWEEPIRAICERLLDGLEGRTECDAALDYAQEIPGEITATMLGVEVADAPQLRTWIHDLMEVGPTDPTLARSTTQAMLGYMHELLADRRENGGDDMVTVGLFQRLADGCGCGPDLAKVDRFTMVRRADRNERHFRLPDRGVEVRRRGKPAGVSPRLDKGFDDGSIFLQDRVIDRAFDDSVSLINVCTTLDKNIDDRGVSYNDRKMKCSHPIRRFLVNVVSICQEIFDLLQVPFRDGLEERR